MTKTHWLQNPNKNFLWHQDMPNGDDMILTIKSGQWEEVKDPTKWTKDMKRVVRFEENIKPFICNETNAEAIMKLTWVKFMEDSLWKQIQLGVSQTRVKKEMVDCIRVRESIENIVIDNKKAIKSLNDCETLDELQNTFLSLSHKEKADIEVITLKDNLKTKLW